MRSSRLVLLPLILLASLAARLPRAPAPGWLPPWPLLLLLLLLVMSRIGAVCALWLVVAASAVSAYGQAHRERHSGQGKDREEIALDADHWLPLLLLSPLRAGAEYLGCYRDVFAAGERDLIGSLLLNEDKANKITPQFCEDYWSESVKGRR